MIVTIHQPEHMSWLGFFHKVGQADLFVILDSVQLGRTISIIETRTANGWTWLTVHAKQK